jgi:hypothetical protein
METHLDAIDGTLPIVQRHQLLKFVCRTRQQLVDDVSRLGAGKWTVCRVS